MVYDSVNDMGGGCHGDVMLDELVGNHWKIVYP